MRITSTPGRSTGMQVNSRSRPPCSGDSRRRTLPAIWSRASVAICRRWLGVASRCQRDNCSPATHCRTNSNVAVPSSTMVTSALRLMLMITWITPEKGSPTISRSTVLSSTASARTVRATEAPPSRGSYQVTW